MPPRAITIGPLSARAGVHVETIRYYERRGLLPPPPRSAGGHRLYDEAHLRRLVFIRRCRELGFTLEAIGELLAMVDGGHSCGEVHELTVEHLGHIRARIADLRRMQRTLEQVAAECVGDAAPQCPIIDTLFHHAAPDASKR